MNQLNLAYIATTAFVGITLFCVGRWSVPTSHARVVYVADAPVRTVNEPLIPPPPPVESSSTVATLTFVRSAVTEATPVPVPPPAPVRSAPAAKNPPPDVVVLEESTDKIQADNPYKTYKPFKKRSVDTPGF